MTLVHPSRSYPKRPLNNVSGIWTRYIKHFHAAGQSLVTRTFNTIVQAPCSSFTHVRLFMANLEATPPTLLGALVGVTATATTAAEKCTPRVTNTVTNNGTTGWQQVTFSGSLQPTLAAKGATNQYPGYIISDWIPLASVAPSDGASLPYLLARVKFQETVSTITTVNNQSDTCADAAVKDSSIYCENFHFTGDGITTPSNFSPGSAQARSALSGFEFMSATSAVRVLCIGDSITGGTDGTSAGVVQNYSWCNRAQENLRTRGVAGNFINYGYGGTLTNVYADYGKLAIARHNPSIAIYSVFSPNDGAPNGQAYVDTVMATAADFSAYCIANGVMPVYSFLAPGTYDASQDGWRKTIINTAKASGVRVMNLSAVIGDGASPERFQAPYDSGDTIHPNAAAFAAQAPVCADFVNNLIAGNLGW